MKKEEAMSLSNNRANLAISYIEKILQDNKDGDLSYGIYSFDENQVCTLSIKDSKNEFDKYLNLGVPTYHGYILYEYLFQNLLETFLEHETIGISKCNGVINETKGSYYTLEAMNPNGNKINIDFIYKPDGIEELIKDYNSQIDQYLNKNIGGRTM